ncbi:MAG: DUF1587 domain-containing protein, partial [Planctomycetota bacterium]
MAKRRSDRDHAKVARPSKPSHTAQLSEKTDQRRAPKDRMRIITAHNCFTIASQALLLLALPVVSLAQNILREDFSSGAPSIRNWRTQFPARWTITDDGVLRADNNADGRSGIGIRSPDFHAVDLRASFPLTIRSFLKDHCFDCHSTADAEGNLDLTSLSGDLTDAEQLRRWVLVHDRVRLGEMPPPDYQAPDENDKQTFLASLSKTLAEAHRSQRETVLRRLNRIEYENTINDLFGINMRLAELLPEDASRDGFDNNGDALVVSAEQIEIYLSAAGHVLDRVIGPKMAPKSLHIDKMPRDLIAENMYSRWFKLMETDAGTIIYSSHPNAGSQLTGIKIRDEGTYRFRLHAKAYQTSDSVLMQVQTGVMRRDGKKRFLGFHTIPPEGRTIELTDYMHVGESIYPRPFGTLPNIASFTRQGERKIEEYNGPGLAISRVEVEGPL